MAQIIGREPAAKSNMDKPARLTSLLRLFLCVLNLLLGFELGVEPGTLVREFAREWRHYTELRHTGRLVDTTEKSLRRRKRGEILHARNRVSGQTRGHTVAHGLAWTACACTRRPLSRVRLRLPQDHASWRGGAAAADAARFLMSV